MKEHLLGEIYKNQASCSACEVICRHRTAPVKGRGHPKGVILVIGEAPGEQEDSQGLSFVGRAGEQLDSIIRDACNISPAKANPSDFYMINAVACRPAVWNSLSESWENRAPTAEEINNCRTWLHQLIRAVDPLFVVLAGTVACSALGVTGAIGKIRGRTVHITIPGVHTQIRYCAMPIYHPSFILRNKDKPQIRQSTVRDLVNVIEWTKAYLRIGRGLSPIPNIAEEGQ